MSVIGNIIWILCGGLIAALEYMVGGVLMCLTIVGIPFGFQLFRLGLLALLPFGQTSVVEPRETGCLSTVMNIIWILIGGVWISLTHLGFGLLLCITIVGIPFGMQHFKLMSMAFTPFGRRIVSC